MARQPIKADWPEIRRLAELGCAIPDLSQQFKVNEATIWGRIRTEDWMTPAKVTRLNKRITSFIANGKNLAFSGKKGEESSSHILNAETWEQKAEKLRALSYQVAYKAIQAAEDQVVIESASDLKAAVHVARQATGLLDTEAPPVALSLFAGGMGLGPAVDMEYASNSTPVRDVTPASAVSTPAITADDGFWE